MILTYSMAGLKSRRDVRGLAGPGGLAGGVGGLLGALGGLAEVDSEKEEGVDGDAPLR